MPRTEATRRGGDRLETRSKARDRRAYELYPSVCAQDMTFAALDMLVRTVFACRPDWAQLHPTRSTSGHCLRSLPLKRAIPGLNSESFLNHYSAKPRFRRSRQVPDGQLSRTHLSSSVTLRGWSSSSLHLSLGLSVRIPVCLWRPCAGAVGSGGPMLRRPYCITQSTTTPWLAAGPPNRERCPRSAPRATGLPEPPELVGSPLSVPPGGSSTGYL